MAYGAPMPDAEQVIDLHTHSRCSDGTQAPGELVEVAAAHGVSVLALTDHDTTRGWAEAGSAAERVGVTLVPGIEISAQADGISVHLLAYLPDPGHGDLVAMLDRVRGQRATRLRTIIERLAADGYPIDYDQVAAASGEGTTLGRPHVADALVAAGCYPDRDAAFADVLHGRSRYYVRHWAPGALEAVEVVQAAGGVPVMAHPFAAARGRTVSDDVIAQMADAGLRGLEVDHRDHAAADRARAAALCERWSLVATGSSDYHGAGKPNQIAEHTTSRAVLDRIMSLASGSSPSGVPLR